MKLAVIAVVTLFAAGCAAPRAMRDDALVQAACPKLTEVTLGPPADSYRLHVEDARRYNICRCAALRYTDTPCPEPKEP